MSYVPNVSTMKIFQNLPRILIYQFTNLPKLPRQAKSCQLKQKHMSQIFEPAN